MKNESYHKKRIAHLYTVISLFLNPLNAELNPIRHLLALVGARHIVHVSRIRVKPLKQRLIYFTFFMLSKQFYSRFVLYKLTNNFDSVLPNLWGRRIYESKFSRYVSFLFPSPTPHPPFFISRITLTFLLQLKTFHLFVTVAMLPRYQSLSC